MQAVLTLVALAALAAPSVQETGPAKEEVQAAVERLKEAFSKGEPADRIEALRLAADVPDERVVEAVAKGLRDRDAEVRKAAIESLRFLEHPAALQALHACYRRDRKLSKDPALGPLLFRAIGQHASPGSIDVLADDAFSTTESAILQARILALANIRTPESVETLIDLMNRAGLSRLHDNMETFRLALVRLTGTDQGTSLGGWQRWWNEVKRDLEVDPEPGKLTRADQLKWDQFWGVEPTRERSGRRGRRGDD